MPMTHDTLPKTFQPKKTVTETLTTVLAETMQLYIMTLNVHWNITGPLFPTIHTMTEQQYTEMQTAIDDLAERLRALGVKAPAGLMRFHDLGSIADLDENAKAEDMLQCLIEANQTVITRLTVALTQATEAGDDVTAGMLTDRLAVHQKSAWMLEVI